VIVGGVLRVLQLGEAPLTVELIAVDAAEARTRALRISPSAEALGTGTEVDSCERRECSLSIRAPP